ncbi:uncharacterized protein PHACADRAFT_254715 [Phanerochaete carnosa HHB-10118-sp]|uniref:Uncharacterized protein n=1 Tax=Phanerochaete carnosa (strain HHB-10118-sp) TaxID=650164 RepID=K5VZX1_PHACS|nr:uncharacterized protein PHACADRAFT_254715 [Phanerochaete carnosa HHB-10118-sp]EKM57138.1 hypothetical protein PHACADRAFT_254715 [Phanerochaete carnosa HHB-10118-sp]
MAVAVRPIRKSSNLENIGVGVKSTSQKVSRAVSQTVFRDASLRRRNRVLSGLKAPKPDDAVKRQKLVQPVVRVNLPTPPASPCTPVRHFERMQIHDSRTGPIPRTLTRPPARLISQEKVADVDPVLAKVPVQYVRDGLKLLGPHMWRVAQSVRIPPFDVKQTYTTVKVGDVNAQMPTHLLAVYKRPAHGKASARGVQLHATHNVIFATHCASIPVLTTGQPTPQASYPGDNITLPVLAMAVPHPESFTAIHEYLYTKDRAVFAARIVPYPSTRVSTPDPAHTHASWVSRLAVTYSQQVLITHLAFAAGAYANMCALGIQDDGMWHALQASWTVLRGALLVQQQAQRAQFAHV